MNNKYSFGTENILDDFGKQGSIYFYFPMQLLFYHKVTVIFLRKIIIINTNALKSYLVTF